MTARRRENAAHNRGPDDDPTGQWAAVCAAIQRAVADPAYVSPLARELMRQQDVAFRERWLADRIVRPVPLPPPVALPLPGPNGPEPGEREHDLR